MLQPKYEVEDGRTVDDNILRFGFDQDKFPAYSLKGYGEFSVVQVCILFTSYTFGNLIVVVTFLIRLPRLLIRLRREPSSSKDAAIGNFMSSGK